MLYTGTENWMLVLPQPIKEKRINELHLVGSHNSAAYKFEDIPTKNILLSKISSKTLDICRKMFCKNLVDDWLLTQEHDIYEQLRSGVRVLHVKMSTTVDEEIVFSNVLGCLRITDFFEQILTFLKSHTGEIVIVSVTPDKSIPEETLNRFQRVWEKFYDISYKIVGHYLHNMRFEELPTLSECQLTNKRLFIDVPLTNKKVPFCFWTNLMNQFHHHTLYDNVTESDVKEDIKGRIFKKAFGYTNKSNKSFGKSKEKKFDEIVIQQSFNLKPSIWWINYAEESFNEKIIKENVVLR